MKQCAKLLRYGDNMKKIKRILENIQRMWTEKNGLRYTLICLVAALVFASFSLVGSGLWREYRDSLIERQTEQMELNVQGIQANLELFFSECVSDLEGLEKSRSKVSHEEGLQLIQNYVKTHTQFVYDICLEEVEKLPYSTKNSRICHIYSASRIDEEKSLLLADLNDGEKYFVIRMETGEKDRISLLISVKDYYHKMLKRVRIGSSGYVVIKDRQGIVLMHPEEKQWGIQVISGRKKLYPNINTDSLERMIVHQKQGLEGVEVYNSYWWEKDGYPLARKISAYAPAWIGDDFLIVSAVMDYNDIYRPIAAGLLRILTFFIILCGLLFVMVWYILHLVSKSRRDSHQIAYLTELNRVLEDMHRSEELIAHRQRLQIMGTMTGGIAHEFNNLLTPILGYADLLTMQLPDGSEEQDYAIEICDAAEKAKDIIRQISSLSRKNMETVYKHVPANKLVIRALKMVRSICPANIQLIEDIRLKEEILLCNETQINQVILNICLNAIQAIGHEQGNLKIRAFILENTKLLDSFLERDRTLKKLIGQQAQNRNSMSESYICMEFQDDGCGMGSDVQNQIFDPFFTTKKGGKGTGLGLALAEQIITSHHGFITVESALGAGSTFRVFLPTADQNQMDFLKPGKERPDSEEKKSILSILLADDNPKVLQLFMRDAERLPVRLVCCSTFEQVHKACPGTFDVLVMEQELNGKSSLGFFASVRKNHPELICILMADRITREIAEAKQKGVLDAYVEKPASFPVILKEVRRRLNEL